MLLVELGLEEEVWVSHGDDVAVQRQDLLEGREDHREHLVHEAVLLEGPLGLVGDEALLLDVLLQVAESADSHS